MRVHGSNYLPPDPNQNVPMPRFVKLKARASGPVHLIWFYPGKTLCGRSIPDSASKRSWGKVTCGHCRRELERLKDIVYNLV